MRTVQTYSPPVDKKIEIYHSSRTFTDLSADVPIKKEEKNKNKSLLGLPPFGLVGTGSRFCKEKTVVD